MVDALSHKTPGRTFMEASPEQRIDVLTRMAKNEMKP
jgi:hypothetical protein